MKMFSDKKQMIFKMRINYKSGNYIEQWFSNFEGDMENLRWTTSISFHEFCYLKDHLGNDKFSIEDVRDMIVDNGVCFPNNILFLGIDEIESVVQIDVKVVDKFSKEYHKTALKIIEELEEK